jgi:hypothetical protein
MEELIQEFRNWQRDWDAYQMMALKNPQYLRTTDQQPPTMDVLIERLNKKYTVKIK